MIISEFLEEVSYKKDYWDKDTNMFKLICYQMKQNAQEVIK